MRVQERKVGARVTLSQAIDRYPHFGVEAGATGTVVEWTEHMVRVRADVLIAGCEEWDNEIQWVPEDDITGVEDARVAASADLEAA